MSKIIFAVHRYYPFPGGSENNVRNMAEEMVQRGHDVTVWSPSNQGDQNGVKVTADPSVLFQPSDLVIIHGCGVGPQDFVANNIQNIPSKVMYMVVKPGTSPSHLNALRDSKFIACCTQEDYEFVTHFGVQDKAVNFRYGILESDVVGKKTFRQKYGLPEDSKMILSCGGYWPNKAMKELVVDYKLANIPNSFLVTTGYFNGDPSLIPENSHNVHNVILEDRQDVMDAMASCDYYIMNSFEEGFGMVLLEAMFNKAKCISRNIAGARILYPYVTLYTNSEQLVWMFQNLDMLRYDTEAAYTYVKTNHTAVQMVDDILKVL